MSNEMIRVAIVGVGSCASALIQGVEYYQRTMDPRGLAYPNIGGYDCDSIEFVLGIDVDSRKVGRKLSDAIYARPNCNMKVVDPGYMDSCTDSTVVLGPELDGIAPHMLDLPVEVSFSPVSQEDRDSHKYEEYHPRMLKNLEVDVLINYCPVGSNKASDYYIRTALEQGVSVVNCIPTHISTEAAQELEALAIMNKCTIVGSDMRSAFGASRLSEVLQGSMMDAGLTVTQHIQLNMAAGTTQGQETVQNGRTANTDFLNMMDKSRLKDKHVSKENVLTGQCTVRGEGTAGMTLYAGPSLTVQQRPGGTYVGSDNKIANLDMVAYGFAGARYELTARLSVQDSPNSAGVVVDALRFCKVANRMDVVGYLRGPSAWTQKTPPVQLSTSDAKFECDAMSRNQLTDQTRPQQYELIERAVGKANMANINNVLEFVKSELEYTTQLDVTSY